MQLSVLMLLQRILLSIRLAVIKMLRIRIFMLILVTITMIKAFFCEGVY